MSHKVGEVGLESHRCELGTVREVGGVPDVLEARHPRVVVPFVVLRSEGFHTETGAIKSEGHDEVVSDKAHVTTVAPSSVFCARGDLLDKEAVGDEVMGSGSGFRCGHTGGVLERTTSNPYATCHSAGVQLLLKWKPQ